MYRWNDIKCKPIFSFVYELLLFAFFASFVCIFFFRERGTPLDAKWFDGTRQNTTFFLQKKIREEEKTSKHVLPSFFPLREDERKRELVRWCLSRGRVVIATTLLLSDERASDAARRRKRRRRRICGKCARGKKRLHHLDSRRGGGGGRRSP